MRPRRRAPLSLTARFAVLFAGFAASLLLLVGIVLERSVETHFDELDEHDLSAKYNMIRNLLARIDSPQAFEEMRQRLDDVLMGHATVAVLMRDEAGHLLYAMRPESFASGQRYGAPLVAGVRHWDDGAVEHIGREAAFVIRLPEPMPVRVLIALDVSQHAHFLTEVRNRLWVAISLAALLAGGLGWLAAVRGLAPLRRVTATARRLSAERLGERLSENDAPAEMLDLVEAFNGMLDRLEAAFRQLVEFSADIAHELRTPVSNLMTETEVALSRTRSAEEYRSVLHSNLEEFERFARMIADMLFLAKADNGLLPRPAESVVLEAEAQALADFYEALAEEKGVQLVVSGSATVTGDHLMLRRALSNLLSNALRYAPSGSKVDIVIDESAHLARVSVINHGDTIPPEQLPLLFERFHRADWSRTRHGEGAGLGLSITRSIAAAHGGTVSAESAHGLTTFTMTLPRVKAADPVKGQNRPGGGEA